MENSRSGLLVIVCKALISQYQPERCDGTNMMPKVNQPLQICGLYDQHPP